MPEKYLYKDKVLQRKEVEDAAKQSGMDIDTYSKKTGLQRVNDNYNFNGKTVPAEEIFEAAKQSKMGFDDYVQKAKITALPDEKKNLGENDLPEPSDGGLNGTTSTIPTIQVSDVELGIDPVSKVKSADDFSKQTRNKKITSTYGGKTTEIESNETEPDPEGIEASDKIISDLEKKGYKKDFIEGIRGLSEDAFKQPETSKDLLASLYQTNPIKFKQLTNEAKNKYAIRDAAAKRRYDELGDNKDRDYIASQTGIIEGNRYSGDATPALENMQQLYDVINKKQSLINSNIDNPEEKKKAQERLKETYSSYINPSTSDFKDEYANSGLTDKLDINQYAGLKTLELFEPEKAKNLLNVVNDNIVPQWNVNVQTSPEDKVRSITTDSAFANKLGGQLSQLTINQRIGKEEVLRELSNIGAGNEYDDLVSQQKDLKKQYQQAATNEEKNGIYAQSLVNEQRIKELENTETENDKKYPLTAQLKYDSQVKEMVNDRGIGVGGFMYNRYAHGVGSGVDAVENLVTSIFGSEADKTKLRMKRIGEGKQFEASVYLPESERRVGSPVILEASDDLKKKVKDILNGRSLSSLSDEEKKQVNDLVANNQDQIKTITNPEAGKSKNFWSKATGMSVAGFTSDMGAFLTKMGLLQGAGLGAKAAEATTLFMDGYEPAFNKKLSEGASVEKASEYGILHGAVLSLMSKFGSKYESIMNVVKGGKSPISKYIAGLSEESWNKLAAESKPLLSKVGKTVKYIGKEQGKMIGTFGVLAPTASSIADNLFYDDNKSVSQMGTEAFESAKEMAIGGIGFGLFGLAKGLTKTSASPVEKAALWEMGDNPEMGKARIDEAIQRNEITKEEGEKKKGIIDNVSKLIEQVPENDDKGKPLDDQKKANYLFNLSVKDSYKQKAKSLPEKQAEKAEMTALVADYKNDLILDPKTDKQLETTKSKLEAQLEKKDENGKSELTDKERLNVQAELEAVNDAIERGKNNVVIEPPKEIPQSVPLKEADPNGVVVESPMQIPEPIKLNEEPQAEISNTETQTGTPNPEPPKNPPAAEEGTDEPSGGVSKKALKKDYGFSKEFASVSDQQVADKAMDKLHQAAQDNGITPEQQAANEVAAMKNKQGEASEHDIMVAAFHLRTLDELIKKANDKGEDASHLLMQRDDALTTLRQLGNNAGRNLRLFGSVYKKVEGGRLEVVRARLSKALGIPEIPKTMIDLKLSKLSESDKKKVEPYVKAIEELNKTLADIKAKTDKGTSDVNSKEVQDYIDAEVARKLKEQKSTNPTVRQKKSQQLKDLAERIRTKNELDKFAKLGEQGGTPINTASLFGDIDFKELAAQAIEYISKGVEKGEDIADLVKKAAIRFKGKFNADEFGKALTTLVSRSSLPDKNEVIDKIKKIAENEGSSRITPDMVKHGLINDVVNDYIHSGTPTDRVIKEATKELKKHLPDVTESQVEDAITKRGEFKQKTKSELNKDVADKTAEVKKLASQKNTERELGKGVRKEVAGKAEIKIAKAAQDFIEEIKNDDTLSEDVKKEHIKAIEAQRDADLSNTRQGVLSNLKYAIDNHISDLSSKINDAIVSGDKETADKIKEVKRDLQDLSDRLNPNDENLKDQIDKADQDLQAIIKGNEGTEFSKDLKDLQDQYHENWQKTADELQHQSLLNKAITSKKESERRLEAGQYTEIPTTPYDVKRDKLLAQAEADSKKAWATLNSLANKAKEQRERKGVIGNWLSARRQWLIMSPGALEKVLGSAITKPILDPAIKQTFGRISGAITGVKPTKFSRIFSTYKQMKNQKSADSFMSKMNDAYVNSIVNHEQVVKKYGSDSPEAKKSLEQLKDAELNHQAALGYLFINANSAIDIGQVMIKGATDLDAKVGKYAQSSKKERTKLQNVAFWIESVNRTHSAMKSVSYRQSMLDHYTENLQYFQKKEGKITDESRQRAWDMAVLAGEEGRFGEATALSRKIGQWKSSSNAAKRNTANYLLPVAKISINITKQGIDMAFPFVEAGARTLGKDAVHGMKLNEADGKDYKNFVSKYYDGIKRGFNELPLEQKKYINTLISRGLFGMAQYALIGYGLASGNIKYGGAYDPGDPFGKNKVKGADGQPLKHGEWEFFGNKAPKMVNLLINHSPYSLPSSIAAVSYEQMKSDDKKGLQIYHAFNKTLNEVYERLPFVTGVDLARAAFGDDYKLQNIIANELPTMKSTSELFDKDSEGNTRAVQVKGDGFWSTTANIYKSKTPGLRNTLPSKTGISDINSPEYKFLAEKGSGIAPYSKSELKPLDKEGKPISVSDSDYKDFLEKREQFIKKDIADLLAGKRHIEDTGNDPDNPDEKSWSVLTKDQVDKITPDELKGFLMTATTRADDKAIHRVFGGRGQAPKEKESRKIE